MSLDRTDTTWNWSSYEPFELVSVHPVHLNDILSIGLCQKALWKSINGSHSIRNRTSPKTHLFVYLSPWVSWNFHWITSPWRDLSMNQINGSIPKEIGHMHNLSHLYTFSNWTWSYSLYMPSQTIKKESTYGFYSIWNRSTFKAF